MSVGGRVQIFSLTHTLRENYLYRTLVLSNSRMPFTSFTSVQSLHKTWSGLEGDSLSGISTFHLIPNWCLLGQKDGKKKKRIYERELPHSYMTRGQRKITSEYFIVWTRMVTTILFSFIPGNQGQPDIFLFTSFHQGKKCPSSKAAVRMSLLWVWKTVLRISFKSLRSCSRLMPLICYVSKGNVTGKG